MSAREAHFPLIGKTLKFVPHQELVMQRMLDVKEDAFLAHHLFVNAQEVKSISACLPVMPFAVSLEMMAEVAAFLAPGSGLIGFENVKASDWIRIEENPTISLRIHAHLYKKNALRTQIFVKIFIEGRTKPAIHGNVVFGIQYNQTIAFSFKESGNSSPTSLTAAEVYNNGFLIQGPVFQVIKDTLEVGDNSFKATLLVHEKSSMFSSMPDPDLLTDPLLMDGVAQMMGLWAMERGWAAFPIGIEKLEFYRPPPPLGTRVPIRGTITQSHVRFLSGNFEIQDGMGTVWFRVQGWKTWVFHWDQKLVAFRRQPTLCCASENVELAWAPPDMMVQFLEKSTLLDFDIRILAEFYLSGEEMDRFRELSRDSKEGESWLYEVIVAKDAYRRWLARKEQMPAMLHPASFCLVKKERDCYSPKPLPNIQDLPLIGVKRSLGQALAIISDKTITIDVVSGHRFNITPTDSFVVDSKPRGLNSVRKGDFIITQPDRESFSGRRI